MPDISDKIRTLREIQDDITRNSVNGSLILVDLVASTAYKTRNNEGAWLCRLFDFYESVKCGLHPLLPVKYLGDAILGFYKNEQVQPKELIETAKKIIHEIDRVNKERRYTYEHQVRIRIVLGYGHVFLFENSDPQGTAVDKLFRLEKYVPDGCVGMDEDFLLESGTSNFQRIGNFSLKGLAGGRHPLYILGNVDTPAKHTLDKARRRAALRDIWDLGKSCDGKIYLISGYIRPDPGQPSTIEMGDKDAIIQVYHNLAKVGRIDNIEVLTSRDAREYHLRENVVSVGGPYWNRVTLRFMREMLSPFVFDFSDSEGDRTPIIDCLEGNRYEAIWRGDQLLRDFGFFARFRNPFNPECHVILSCGIETQSVYGIAQVFSEEQNEFLRLYDAILSKADLQDDYSVDMPDFFALMPFEVADNGLVNIPIANDQTRYICLNWKNNHSGTLQGDPLK
jgi:hypothetical protein